MTEDPYDPPAYVLPTIDDIRREQYARRADPLFFKWQMQLATGEGDPEETRLAWLAERAAIQAEFPEYAD